MCRYNCNSLECSPIILESWWVYSKRIDNRGKWQKGSQGKLGDWQLVLYTKIYRIMVILYLWVRITVILCELRLYCVKNGYTWPHGWPFVPWECLVEIYRESRCLISPWYMSHIFGHWAKHYKARNVSLADRITVIPGVNYGYTMFYYQMNYGYTHENFWSLPHKNHGI